MIHKGDVWPLISVFLFFAISNVVRGGRLGRFLRKLPGSRLEKSLWGLASFFTILSLCTFVGGLPLALSLAKVVLSASAGVALFYGFFYVMFSFGMANRRSSSRRIYHSSGSAYGDHHIDSPLDINPLSVDIGNTYSSGSSGFGSSSGHGSDHMGGF